MLVPLATATIYTGYSLTHGWFDNYYRMATIHRVIEWIFLPILITHIIYTAIFMRAKWSRMISNVKNRRATFLYVLKITSRVSSWLIIITAIFVVLSGLNGYEWYASSICKVITFEWHRIFDSLLTIFIIIHVAIGVKFVFIRNKVKSITPNTATTIATSSLITIIIIAAIPKGTIFFLPDNDRGINASLRIGTDSFDFNSSLVETVRPDIFQMELFPCLIF